MGIIRGTLHNSKCGVHADVVNIAEDADHSGKGG